MAHAPSDLSLTPFSSAVYHGFWNPDGFKNGGREVVHAQRPVAWSTVDARPAADVKRGFNPSTLHI